MNALTNQTMSVVDDPRRPGVRYTAPKKIFKACVLLDVVIPRWQFNNFDGYIMSSDNAEDIDALERTADWSREQQDMEEGRSQGPRASPQGRGAGPWQVPRRAQVCRRSAGRCASRRHSNNQVIR